MKYQINYRSTVDEISAVCDTILSMISKYDFSEDQYLTQVISTLKDYNSKITEVIGEEKVKSTLAPLDQKRDNSARVIFLEIKAKLLWPNERMANAAQIVSGVLDNYGMELLNLSYNAESSKINALLKDLEKEEIQVAIDVLPGLSMLIDQLRQDQDIFEKAYMEYLDDKSIRQNTLSAGKLAEIIRNQINDNLISYVEIMSKVKNEDYLEFVQVFETILKEHNSNVKPG